MAWRIVKQPNGLLARFSDVVDSFTHWNLTEAQAIDLCLDYEGRQDAVERVQRGLRDEPSPPFLLASGRDDGLDRFRDCIETIRDVHGKKDARLWEQDLSTAPASTKELQCRKVEVYIKRHGPSHAADIWRDCGIPRGSIYLVLRDPRFRQLSNSRWELATEVGE